MKHHLCHVFPNFGTGGPEVRTVVLMNALADRFRHTVVALNGNFEMRRCVSDEVEVEYVDGTAAGGMLRRMKNRARLLREIAPDLLVTYGWGGTDALVSARFAGIRPVIHTEDGFLPDEVGQQKRRRLYFRRLAFRTAQRLVVPSHTLEAIAAKQWRIPDGKLSYIPNGVDTERFSPIHPKDRSLAQKLGLEDASLVIGTVGALRPEKNQTRLIRTAAELLKQDGVHLLLVGDGNERDAIAEMARQLGIEEKVHFSGNVTDPAPCYRLMDVFALTSDTEQMPISLLEAMATGLPVAATDVGDVFGMVADAGQALIVPVGDENRLTQAMKELAKDSGLRERLGGENRRKCLQEFSQNAMIERYAECYVDTIEGGCGRRTVSTSVTSVRG